MTDTTEIAALRAQLKRVQQHRNNVVEALGIALEALRWYADEGNYYDPTDVPDHLYRDSGDVLLIRGGGGQRARAALAALKRSDVTRLRERIETRVRHDLDEVRLHIDTLSELLDIVEEMAAVEPYEPAIGERHELECLFCGELGDRLPNTQTTVSHTPDCAYMRAREMCGMEQDGAS